MLLVSFCLREKVMGALFCHWEPSIRRLMHMLLVHRMFPPRHRWQQQAMIAAVQKQLGTRVYQPLAPERFRPKGVPVEVALAQCEQIEMLRGFLSIVIQCHSSAAPPYTVKTVVKAKAVGLAPYFSSKHVFRLQTFVSLPSGHLLVGMLVTMLVGMLFGTACSGDVAFHHPPCRLHAVHHLAGRALSNRTWVHMTYSMDALRVNHLHGPW
jgi:hypothetical protein